MIGLSMYPRISRGGSNSTLADFCEMVAYTADLAGVDTVALGTDFYTGYPDTDIITWWRAGTWARESPIKISPDFSDWPSWFRNPSDYPNVIAGLESKGFSTAKSARSWVATGFGCSAARLALPLSQPRTAGVN